VKSNLLIALAAAQLCYGCSTLDQSLRLGAATGSLAGAAATFGSERASGRDPSMENVAVGASVGLAVGLLTSYFVHNAVASDSADSQRQTEMYFGDLPPSPFVFPNQNSKKGGH
jgi:predicted RNA methylase